MPTYTLYILVYTGVNKPLRCMGMFERFKGRSKRDGTINSGVLLCS